jgi:hypothetical protein
LHKGGVASGSSNAATANTWVWSGTANSKGFEIRPDGVTTTMYLPASGYRSGSNGLLYNQGGGGNYWTTGISGINAIYLYIDSGTVNPSGSNNRSFGFSLRCVKN